MVTLSPKRIRSTKQIPHRTTVWKLRLVLYGLSLLTLLFSILLVVLAPSKAKSKSTVFEQQIPEDRYNLVNRDLESQREQDEKAKARQKPWQNIERQDIHQAKTTNEAPRDTKKGQAIPELETVVISHPEEKLDIVKATIKPMEDTEPRGNELSEDVKNGDSKQPDEPRMENPEKLEQMKLVEENGLHPSLSESEKSEQSDAITIDSEINATFDERIINLIDPDENVPKNINIKEPDTVSDSVTAADKHTENVENNLSTTEDKHDALQLPEAQEPPVAPEKETVRDKIDSDINGERNGERGTTAGEETHERQPQPEEPIPPKIQQDVDEGRPDRPPSMFIVIADSRSGSDWIMNTLDQHPNVCASGEAGATPGTLGFPSGVLIPDGMPWFADSELKQGCILAFVKKHVTELLLDANRCSTTHDASNDPLQVHLPRLCRFVEKLQTDGALDKTNKPLTEAMITRLYMDAFATDDDGLVPCRCPESTKIRGTKVMADWEERISGFLDHHENIKVIRLRRKNLFSRYMSLTAAITTNVWQTPTVEEKQRQLDALPSDFAIDLDRMMSQLHFLNQDDARADAWALHHVKSDENLLNIEFEDCRDNSFACFQQILQFLGSEFAKTFVESHIGVFSSPFADSNVSKVSTILGKVSNADFVREALGAGGYGTFVGVTDYKEIQHLHLVSDTDAKDMVIRTPPHESAVNITVMIIDFKGSSSHKFESVCSALKAMSDNTMVVISLNGKESSVSINPHIRSHSMLYSSVCNFRDTLMKLSGKILVSASEYCCPSALSHAQPGELFEMDPDDSSRLRRRKRTCLSGEPGCGWNGDKNGIPWRTKLRQEARKHLPESNDGFMYLDASLLAGKAADIRSLFETLDVSASEDEKAVLTDYFLLRPDSIVLDYGREFFGQYFPGVKHMTRKGCFLSDEKKPFKRNRRDGPLPLFVHTGSDLGCHEGEKIRPMEKFPKWDENGIRIQSVIDHIDRVLIQNISMAGIDRHFEPEILYLLDQKGLWASNVNREKYRIVPTERFLVRAFEILASAEDNGRWSDLIRIVKSSGFPYWAWYGDLKSCIDRNYGDESIPLFTTCAVAGCAKALPSPAYMTIIESQQDTRGWFSYFQRYDVDYPWESKLRKVVWRGSLSETNPDFVLSSERYRLCELVAQRPDSDSDIFDVGFTYIPDYVSARTKIDINELGGFKADISPMIEFQKYIAILDLDGSSWSSRFGSLLCYNSVIIKVQPAFVDYFFYELIPWKHYIPVKGDFSDLVENVAFATDPKNDEILKEIVASANQWCAERLVYDQLAHDQLDIWQAYIGLLTKGDINWQEKWRAKKSELILGRENKYGMIQLNS